MAGQEKIDTTPTVTEESTRILFGHAAATVAAR